MKKSNVVVLLVGLAVIGALSSVQAGAPDGIDLTVTKGPGPDDVTLDWAGGQPGFEVFRGTSPQDVSLPINLLGQTNVYTWPDTAFASDLYFYLVRSTCAPNPPDLCDGLDNDCDGSFDEDHVTVPTGCGVGACEGNQGELVCRNGKELDTCDPFAGATSEVCDGLDNDCALGTADGEEDPQVGTPCDGSDQDLCFEGTRICTAGTLACSDNSGTLLDVCNGSNDDCDATSADGSEDPEVGTACDGADGDLCIEGTRICHAGALACFDDTGTTVDLCNNLNDDCDPASADGSEDPQFGDACDGTDTDLCIEGTRNCVGGVLGCTDTTASATDVCNGLNDDCDPASADGSEDPQVGMVCDGPDGDQCLEGTRTCTGGGLVCTDNTGTIPEACNGLDDDCDGTPDDGINTNDNPVCSAGTFFVGSVSGDTGNDTLTDSWIDEEWDRVTIREDSNSSIYVSATIQLFSPPGTDFDLFVRCVSCGGGIVASSTVHSLNGHNDVVLVRADDQPFFVNDTFDVIIEIRRFNSTICASWTLTVFGNTAVNNATCD